MELTVLTTFLFLPNMSWSESIGSWFMFGRSYGIEILDASYNQVLYENSGFLKPLVLLIKFTLELIHIVIPSWGFSVILLAILVRLLLYPLMNKAILDQRKFEIIKAKINPDLEEIKKKYRGGELAEETLLLYKRYESSPFHETKPFLIFLLQIPIFVSLYFLLDEFPQFKGQSFLWIESLSEPDRFLTFENNYLFFGHDFNLLPIIMALSSILSLALKPTKESLFYEGFAKNIIMIIVAILCMILFYNFPSGIVLYWTIANLLHFFHVLICTKKTA